MSLGLLLGGAAPGVASPDGVAAWLAQCCPEAPLRRGVGRADEPVVFLGLHPAGEEVEISWPAPGRLAVEASTSSVGPGYHAHVVGLLDALAAAFGVAWDPPDAEGEHGDETGYFLARDQAALEREMLTWLRVVAGQVNEPGDTVWDVAMPLEHGFTFRAHSRTAIGPRDATFWSAVAAGRGDGRAFFPWFEAGKGAGYHRGLALTLLWCEVRWRPPDTEEEEALLRRVAEALAAAHAADPGLELPWRAWGEVLDLLQEEGSAADAVRARARSAPPAPPIGYRREPVRVRLAGGWSVELPGSCSEHWEEATFSASDGGRYVWFTAFRRPGALAADEAGLAKVIEGAVAVHRRDEEGLRGVAGLHRMDRDGAVTWLLRSETSTGDRTGALTIAMESEEDGPWAVETWRSLRRG